MEQDRLAAATMGGRRYMRRLILATILCCGFVSGATADPIPMSPELRAFMMRPDQQQAVSEIMAKQWRLVDNNCTSPKFLGMNVLVATPPNFDASGAPVSGNWRVLGRIEGCGAIRLFNVEYLFASDGQMKRIGLLPGTTIADFRLQRDALMYAAMGMTKRAPKNCKDIQYQDTKFVGFADEGSNAIPGKRPWKEEWTVRACGVTGIVTMHFTPDATGTNIMSSPNETREVTP